MAQIEVNIAEASYIRGVLAEKLKREEQEIEATKALSDKIDAAFKSETTTVEPVTDTPVETPAE